MDQILQIWIPVLVIVFLTFYLYDVGANRVYDVILSAIAIVVTSPVIGILALISKIKNGKVFEKSENDLLFTFPENRLRVLPRLFLVFIGRRRILPERLKDWRL